MNINKFNNKNILEHSLAEEITSYLSDAIKKYGDARILLSGGSTPLNLYSILARNTIDWKNVKIGLVDERFVTKESNYNNEWKIKNCFSNGPAKAAKIIGMVYNIEEESTNIKIVNKHYSDFFERIDFTLLGMGNDGHTASLFPNDQESNKLINSSKIGIYSTKAPEFPYKRITCSKDLLTTSHNISLYLKGENKLNILKNSTSMNMPISYFINNYKKLKIYYTN